MSQLSLTIDGSLMTAVNDYLADKQYKLAKPFYDGISASPTDGNYVMTQQSLKVLLKLLSGEITVQLYEKFSPMPGQMAAKEAAMKAAAEADNIVPVSQPEIEEVKDSV